MTGKFPVYLLLYLRFSNTDYNQSMKKTILIVLNSLLLSSCSLFGIQSESGPDYTILVKEGDFEIRKYAPYLVAKTTVDGNYKEVQGLGFRILAGYIFGKNHSKSKIAMTSPVSSEKSSPSEEIAMTSPVEMKQELRNSTRYTMSFTMPSKYSLETLPDNRIQIEQVPARIVASYRYTWSTTKEINLQKSKELKKWLETKNQYTQKQGFSFAGYNPPWTISFLRRNEIHIELKRL
jgi:hypothetical protein